MASDTPPPVTAIEQRSPWWYRYRFFTIGAAYGIGFFVGNAISFGPSRPLPAAWAWGPHLGAHGTRSLLVLAFVLALGAWAVRSWGGAYLRPDVVWHADALGDRLLVDGPFRYVRNPLYFGNVLLAAGMGLLAPPLGFFLIVAGNIVVALALIRVEATLLRNRYGAVYDEYAAAVPPLVPRLTPAEVRGSIRGTPSLALGLRSEIFSAALAATVLAVAIFAPA